MSELAPVLAFQARIPGRAVLSFSLLLAITSAALGDKNPPAPPTDGDDTQTGNVLGAPSFSGKTMTIELANVGNAQTLTLQLSAVNGGDPMTIPMAILLGDTNGDGTVNSGDALQTRTRAGQACDATTFRSDVNADGSINSGDALLVRKNSGSALTP